MSQLDKGKSKARDTPPTLFLHAPRAGSNVSLSGPGAAASGLSAPQASSLQRNTSLRHSDHATLSHTAGLDAGRSTMATATAPHNTAMTTTTTTPAFRSAGIGGISLPLKIRQESTRASDRTDALWAEMQATLEEVELSASGGTRVFGPDHDRKLAELRAAQIALAQAWARSEADEAIETNNSTDGGGGDMRNFKVHAAGAATATGIKDAVTGGEASAGKTEGAAAGGSTATGSARPGSAGLGAERLGAKMEEETEVDILLARKRREANDRYFHRVNQGVLDVVAKLDDVAVAMRAVEQESKEVWGENEHYQESVAGSTKT